MKEQISSECTLMRSLITIMTSNIWGHFDLGNEKMKLDLVPFSSLDSTTQGSYVLQVQQLKKLRLIFKT